MARPGPRPQATARKGEKGALKVKLTVRSSGVSTGFNQRQLVGVGRGEVRVNGALIGKDNVFGLERVAVVERQPVAELEAVVQAVLADRPGFGQVGQETQLGVELDKAGKNNRQESRGDIPEVDLSRIESSGSG